VTAAWRVLGAARRLSPALATIVDAATLLSDAYVSVAAVPVAKEDRLLKFDMARTPITRTAAAAAAALGGGAAQRAGCCRAMGSP